MVNLSSCPSLEEWICDKKENIAKNYSMLPKHFLRMVFSKLGIITKILIQ